MLFCGLGAPSALSGEGESGLVITDAWVRAMPPNMKNTAAYLTVTNESEQATAIKGATADAADKTELHTTRQVDGLMRMQKLEGLALASGETTTLEPGGTHLMLLGLTYSIEPGDEVEICLQTATGPETCATAIVSKGSDRSSGQNHQHH